MKKITLLIMVCMLFGSMTHATNYYTATASTNMEVYGTNTIDRVVDGDLNSKFWSAKPQAAGQYVKLDLSKTKTIGFIDIYFAEGDQPVAAKLSISENDADWTDLVNFSKSDISNNQYSYNASGHIARYIKMELTGSNSNWFQMCEFRVEEYIAAAPSRTISVSVNDKNMGQAYIDNIETTSKTAEGSIEIKAQANENHEFVNWMLKDGTWAGNTAIYRDNTAGDKEYVAIFGATFPTGYCEPSKRINESCADSNVDDVHSHGIRSLSVKVNGQEVISIGETKTTFNYVQNTQKFSVKPGQEITFDFLTGRWANNMWIGCDWDRDGTFEDMHVLYETGIPTSEQQTNENITGTYTITVPETALAGLSRIRIISDGIVCQTQWPTDYHNTAIMCGTYGDGVVGYAGSVHDLGVNVFKTNKTTTLVQPSQHNAIVKGLANGISIETTNQINVSIFSITGLMVCNQTINKNEFIKVPTGIYAVRAGNQIFKVVVK